MEKAEFLNLISQHWDDIKELQDSKTLYDLEKDFDQIWVGLGRDVLEKTIGKVPSDRRKKKFTSRYGKIEVGKESPYYFKSSGCKLTPYCVSLCVLLGQGESYRVCSEFITQLLRVEISCSTIYRTTNCYGAKAGNLLNSINWEENYSQRKEQDSNLISYGSIDGSMILTREQGWKEVKVGRAINSEHIDTSNENRSIVEKSAYIAHLGSFKEFEPKVKKLISQYTTNCKSLILINDGALWIDKLNQRCFPEALSILDYYHGAERLGEFALYNLAPDKYKDWIKKQCKLLYEKGGIYVYDEIKKLKMSSKKKEKNKEALLTYINNNVHKMNYPLYVQKKYYIGSGHIESAHKFVIQHRMKQAGQRWSISGARRMLDLRVLKCSDKWQLIIDQIKNAA